MKKNLFFLLITFVISIVNAQDIQINWGPEYKNESNKLISFVSYGGHTSKAYYVVERSLKTASLSIYNFNFNRIANQEIQLTYGKSAITPLDIINTKSGNYYILGGYDRKDKTSQIYYTNFTPSNTLNTNYKSIVEFPCNINDAVSLFNPQSEIFLTSRESYVNSVEKSVNKNSLFSVSYDSTKVLIPYTSSTNSNDNVVLSYLVLDDKMNKVFDKKISLSYQKKNFKVLDNFVMDNGDIYVTAKHYENDKDRATPNYKFYIIKMNEKEQKNIELKLSNAAPLNANVLNLNNGNIIILGTYTNISNNKDLWTNGFYSAVYNTEGNLISSNTFPFSEEVKDEIFNNNENKIDKGAKAFVVKNIYFDKQSKTASICIEKVYKTEFKLTKYSYASNNTFSKQPQTNLTNIYHSDEIVVAKFDENGKQLFETFIDKRFYMEESMNNHNSFSFCVNNGNYYFLFNNYKGLLEKKEADVNGKIVTDLVKVDENGKIVFRKTLFANKDVGVILVPKMSDYLGNKQLLIYGSKNKGYKYGTLSLPD